MTKPTGDQNTLKSEKPVKFPKLAKATEYGQNQKIRAEKSEAENKELKAKLAGEKPPKPSSGEDTPKNYSLQDIRALSDVHDDDVDRVVRFSKSENISITEAKAHSDMKAILTNRKEQRKTADATNTGGGKRGSSKISASTLLSNAEKGILPESDEDMNRLVDARHERERTSRRPPGQ